MPSKKKPGGGAQAPLFREERPFRSIGLDLSLRGAGIVVLAGDGEVLEAATFGRGLEQGATVAEKLDRIVDVAVAIRKVVERYVESASTWEDLEIARKVRIGVEGYALDARFGGAALGELNGVVKVDLYQRFGIAPVVVQPSSARKIVLGHGGIKKKDVGARIESLRRAGDIRGADLVDHNQRDAWVVAEYVRLTCRGE